MDPVKQKRDELFIEKLELMNEYIIQKYQLEALIKSGCLHLAKTRYVDRRPNYITTLQLPTSDSTNEIKAIYNVNLIETNTEIDEEDKENFKNNETQKQMNKKKNKTKLEKTNESSKDEMNDDTKDSYFELIKHDRNKNNPLNWFGVLVSQSLRYAQTDFQKCIDLAVAISNIQLRLRNVEQKMKLNN